MGGRWLRTASLALVALALFATVAGGNAQAKKGVGKSVDSTEIEDGTIQCVDLNAAVGTCPFVSGGQQPPPPSNSSGVTLNFNAKLSANQVKSITIGNFTESAAANAAGACQTGRLAVGNVASQFAFDGGAFTPIPANGQNAHLGANDQDTIIAFSNDGASTVGGVLGEQTVGAFCITGGFLSGV